MGLRSVCPIAFVLLFAFAPSCLRDSPAPRVRSHLAASALSPEIEAQIRTVESLAGQPGVRRSPDPRLFGAIARLEEMLPRSAATRAAQVRGRRAYLDILSSHSMKRLAEWPAIRESIERETRRDPVYVRSLAAIDRRLEMHAPSPVAGPAIRHTSLPFDEMRPGDVMIWDDRSGPPLVRVALSIFAWKSTHSAVYLGETRSRRYGLQRWTLEAQSPSLGVRRAAMGRKWLRPGLHVALGHVIGLTPAQAARFATAAEIRYGVDGRTPYHVWPPWDKSYTADGMYCSQLVWSVYRDAGIDLDSNDWHYIAWFAIHNWFDPYAAGTAYTAVFPDEIKASPHIAWYYDQVNP